jgi:hypothetical protein
MTEITTLADAEKAIAEIERVLSAVEGRLRPAASPEERLAKVRQTYDALGPRLGRTEEKATAAALAGIKRSTLSLQQKNALIDRYGSRAYLDLDW